jgi:signal transduction histidine kinase
MGQQISPASANPKATAARHYADESVISILNHELKNPLTVISSYSQLLERRSRGVGDARSAKSARVIAKNADTLAAMISSITDAMKIDAGLLRFHDTAVVLLDEVKIVLANCRALFPSYQIELECEERSKNYTVSIDPARFRQMLQAVVVNAAVYSPESSKIVIRMSHTSEAQVISVHDWGVGIPESALHFVTRAYYRGDETHALQQPGLGLGLFIAQSICAKYSGSLTIESKVASSDKSPLPKTSSIGIQPRALSDSDSGTTVTLSLPFCTETAAD